MQNWDDLRFVLALYRHKTMSRASESLGTNIATVSRRIERITSMLDEALFVKTDNTWVPTPLCQQLVNVARTTEQQLSGVEAHHVKAPEPGSIVRINCDLTILQAGVAPRLRWFLEANPNLNLDLTFRRRSLAYAETDLTVGYTEPQEGRIMRKRVGAMRLRPFTSRSFIDHTSGWLRIDYGSAQADLDRFMENVFCAPPRATLEGVNLTKQFMVQGPWAALLPSDIGLRDGSLTEIDLGFPEQRLDVWMSYHSSRRLDPLVRLAAEFVEDCFATH